uniref:Putative ovule protein n=1 Tax=Solanum chacoense TaxID=4108 RepID=A0A0V0HNB0_SOLCH
MQRNRYIRLFFIYIIPAKLDIIAKENTRQLQATWIKRRQQAYMKQDSYQRKWGRVLSYLRQRLLICEAPSQISLFLGALPSTLGKENNHKENR